MIVLPLMLGLLMPRIPVVAIKTEDVLRFLSNRPSLAESSKGLEIPVSQPTGLLEGSPSNLSDTDSANLDSTSASVDPLSSEWDSDDFETITSSYITSYHHKVNHEEQFEAGSASNDDLLRQRLSMYNHQESSVYGKMSADCTSVDHPCSSRSRIPSNTETYRVTTSRW